MSDLKPCPFCGGPAEIWHSLWENAPRKAWVACQRRCAILINTVYDDDERSIAAWNRRAPDPKAAALSGATPPADGLAEALEAIIMDRDNSRPSDLGYYILQAHAKIATEALNAHRGDKAQES